MASGHASSCDKATIGSVCYCACAGVRHSIALTGTSGNLPGIGATPDPAATQPTPEPAAADRGVDENGTRLLDVEVVPVNRADGGESGGEAAEVQEPLNDTDKIRKAYADILADRDVSGTNNFVMMSTVRDAAGLTQEQFDTAIRKLRKDDDVYLVPEANQKVLTAEQRAAAVVIGNQEKHLISIG